MGLLHPPRHLNSCRLPSHPPAHKPLRCVNITMSVRLHPRPLRPLASRWQMPPSCPGPPANKRTPAASTKFPARNVYQYDVQIGNTVEKNAAIKKIWNCSAHGAALFGIKTVNHSWITARTSKSGAANPLDQVLHEHPSGKFLAILAPPSIPTGKTKISQTIFFGCRFGPNTI
ncbi:hypothetical protein CNMCM5623_007095 [Aspergillus felis]|uniref:Uncharacterized protein n=1 Tax=Aspergillus felis TaxID=1287682 RepID=A0A8H6V5A1_9EURO|nr:hypothetical protein CNMCM5623_007095 [Aspergillus felis]